MVNFYRNAVLLLWEARRNQFNW